MQQGLSQARRVIAVLSPAYLKSDFTTSEWLAAFAKDPLGNERTLIPVRILPCELKGLLPQIVYADLVGLDEDAAVERLLSAVNPDRPKPKSPPSFPGAPPKPPEPVPDSKPPFPGGLPEHWNVPPQNKLFTGRNALLQQIHDRAATDGVTALNQPLAIAGLGGVGKTQTALEYAHRFGREYDGGVFWVKADTETNLVSGYTEIASTVRLSVAQSDDQKLIIDAVKQ